MKPDANDLFLGQIACNKNYVTWDQLQECIAIQKKMHAMGIERTLLEVMVYRKYLGSDDEEKIRRRGEYTRERDRARAMARKVLDEGLLAEEEVRSALDEHKERFRVHRQVIPFADILEKLGVAAEEVRRIAPQVDQEPQLHDSVLDARFEKLANDLQVDLDRLGGPRGAEPPSSEEGASPVLQPDAKGGFSTLEGSTPLVGPHPDRKRKRKGVLGKITSIFTRSQLEEGSEVSEATSSVQVTPPPSDLRFAICDLRSSEADAADRDIRKSKIEDRKSPSPLPPEEIEARRRAWRRFGIVAASVVGLSGAAALVVAVGSASRQRDYRRAVAYLQRGEYDEAERAFRSYLKDYPEGALALKAREGLQKVVFVMGEIARDQGESAAALRYFQEVLVIDRSGETATRARAELALLARRRQSTERERRDREILAGLEKHRDDPESARRYVASAIVRLSPELRDRLTGRFDQLVEAHRRKLLATCRRLELREFDAGGAPVGGAGAAPGPGDLLRLPLFVRAPAAVVGRPSLGRVTLFVMVGGDLRGVRASDGATRWALPLEAAREPVPVGDGNEALTAEDASQCLVASTRRVVLVDVSGRVLWRKDLPGVPAARPTVASGRVWLPLHAAASRAGGRSGLVLELELATGRAAGAYRTLGAPAAPVAVDRNGTFLVAASTDDHTYVFHLPTGQLVARLAAPGQLNVRPLVVPPFLATFSAEGDATRVRVHRIRTTGSGRTMRAEAAVVNLFRISGRLEHDPHVAGGFVVLQTTGRGEGKGELAVLEFNPGSPDEFRSLSGQHVWESLPIEGPYRFASWAGGRSLALVGSDLVTFRLEARGKLLRDFLRRTGSLRESLGKRPFAGRTRQRPLLAADRLFVLREEEGRVHRLWAIDPRRMKVDWVRTLGAAIESSPVDAGDGRVLAATAEGSVHSMYVNDRPDRAGRIHHAPRRLPISGGGPDGRLLPYPAAGPALLKGPDGPWLAIASASGLRLVHPVTGEDRSGGPAHFDVGAAPWGPARPVDAMGRVVVVTASGIPAALPFPGPGRVVLHPLLGEAPLRAPPVVAGRDVFLVREALHCIGLVGSGDDVHWRQRWRLGGERIETSPLVGPRIVHVAVRGALLAVGRDDGRIRRRISLPGAVPVAPPLPALGAILVVDRAGNLWRVAPGAASTPARVAPRLSRAAWIVDGGRVYLGDEAGTVLVLEAASGRVVRRLAAAAPITAPGLVRGREVYFPGADGCLHVLRTG